MKLISRTKRGGFTLIELLVVIAIIAILAAILFPVFAKVREKARQTSCLSNEKQLALGYIQYYQDYDENFPYGTAVGASARAGYGIGWAGQIYPYVKSAGVYECPDDETTNISAGKSLVSYAVNAQLAGTAHILAAAGQPSSTVLFSEIDWNYEHNGFFLPEQPVNSRLSAADFGDNLISAYGLPPGGAPVNGACCDGSAGTYDTGPILKNDGASGDLHDPANNGNQSNPARHTGGANWTFVDGHAKWLRGTNVDGTNGLPVAGSTQCPVAACYYPYS